MRLDELMLVVPSYILFGHLLELLFALQDAQDASMDACTENATEHHTQGQFRRFLDQQALPWCVLYEGHVWIHLFDVLSGVITLKPTSQGPNPSSHSFSLHPHTSRV